MSKWNVGDIVIEMRHEPRQAVTFTPRRVSKVGRKYFYLDFEKQSWRNGTKFQIEDGIEHTQYSALTRVFASTDALHKHLTRDKVYPALNKKGLRIDFWIARPTLEQLISLCRVMECYEDVETQVNEILDKVKVEMLELRDKQQEVSL